MTIRITRILTHLIRFAGFFPPTKETPIIWLTDRDYHKDRCGKEFNSPPLHRRGCRGARPVEARGLGSGAKCLDLICIDTDNTSQSDAASMISFYALP